MTGEEPEEEITEAEQDLCGHAAEGPKEPQYRRKPAQSRLLVAGLFIGDLVLVNLAVVLTFWVRYLGEFPAKNVQAYYNMAVFIILLRVVGFFVFGLYRMDRRRSVIDLFYLTFLAVTASSVVIVAATFIWRQFAYPRTVIAISWLFNIFLVGGFRTLVRAMIRFPMEPRRVMVVGGGGEARTIVRDIEMYTPNEYRVVGLLEPAEPDGVHEEITMTMENLEPDLMILAHPGLPESETLGILEDCVAREVEVAVHPNLYEVLIGRVEIKEVAGIPLIEIRTEPLEGWQRLAKRIFDLTVTVPGIILLLPMWLVIPLFIKRNSSGPVFFIQERVGLRGRRFNIIKFRSMKEGAEAASGPVLAKPGDKRVTGTGRWLRRYRLDELPQLFNVLTGDMSLVGPRPERPEFVNKFMDETPSFGKRLAVKPGITGLAQIHGRYDTTPENKLRYDLAYINGWRFLLDIKILVLTLRVIFKGKGAL